MADILHRLHMRAPLDEVFGALHGHHDAFDVRFDDAGVHARLHLDEAPRAGRISWRCVEGPPDWLGTHVTIDLARDGDATVVKLTHRDWARASDFMGDCSAQWAYFLLHLKTRLETPEPEDLYIG